MSAFSEMERTMTQQTPEAPAPAAPPAPTPQPAPVPTPPPAAEKQPPWGDDKNFNPEEAWKTIQNLRKEKGGGDSSDLKAQLEAMKTAQTQQRDALAAALGVKPEETSDSDKLAQQIQGLQAQILSSEKRALAVEFKVPENMLTATDAETLRQQATSLAEFAQAAHYAASTNTPPPPPPAFQQNPGQGQGNAPLSPEAQAEAEYEKYFPTKK